MNYLMSIVVTYLIVSQQLNLLIISVIIYLGKVNMIRQELDANTSASSNLNTYNYDPDIVCRLSQF